MAPTTFTSKQSRIVFGSEISLQYLVMSPSDPAEWTITACSKPANEILLLCKILSNKESKFSGRTMPWSNSFVWQICPGHSELIFAFTFSKAIPLRESKIKIDPFGNFLANVNEIHSPRPRLAPLTTTQLFFWNRFAGTDMVKNTWKWFKTDFIKKCSNPIKKYWVDVPTCSSAACFYVTLISMLTCRDIKLTYVIKFWSWGWALGATCLKNIEWFVVANFYVTLISMLTCGITT